MAGQASSVAGITGRNWKNPIREWIGRGVDLKELNEYRWEGNGSRGAEAAEYLRSGSRFQCQGRRVGGGDREKASQGNDSQESVDRQPIEKWGIRITSATWFTNWNL